MKVLCSNNKEPKLYEVSKSGLYKAFVRREYEAELEIYKQDIEYMDNNNVTDYNEQIEGVPIGDD